MSKSKNTIVGYIDYDTQTTQPLNLCRIIATKPRSITAGRFLLVEDKTLNRKFIVKIISGPLYIPSEISPRAPIKNILVTRGVKITYTVIYEAEIVGEIDEKTNTLTSTLTRPSPTSPVLIAETPLILEALGLKRKGMLIGHILGSKGLKLHLDPNDPNFLPRNVAIFGTVGSGKSNTAQVLIEEASKYGWAVIVFDIEGEYLFLDQPNDNPKMVSILESDYHLEPEGIEKFQTYVPYGGDIVRTDTKIFTIPFGDLIQTAMNTFFDIIEATEAQRRYFTEILTELRRKMAEKHKAYIEEELPDYLLTTEEKEKIAEKTLTIQDYLDEINRKIQVERSPHKRLSLETLASKLETLEKQKIFNHTNNNIKQLNITEMLKPGKVSVIDISTVNDQIRNIIISYTLAKIFQTKIKNIKTTPKTMIIIEEAHSYISREKAKIMKATVNMLQTITRRGRKRWISLVFISQHPKHLPDEIFELTNTMIIHKLRSEENIKPVAYAASLTTQEKRIIPTLRTGEALISTPTLPSTIRVKIRPAKTKRTIPTQTT